MDFDNEEDEGLMSRYMELGIVSIEGMDENGDVIYSIDQDLAKELAPELWQAHTDYVDKSLLELYEAGLVSLEYNENLEATIHLSPEGHRIAKEKGLIEIDPNSFRDVPND